MLYFSKLKIISVVIFTLLLSYFSLSNFTKIDDDFFKKNINLGLDLQGGSYLLLEIDNSPVLEQQIQNKLIQIKKFLKEKKIPYKNFNIIDDKKISFEINNEFIDSTSNLLKGKDSEINPYYDQFKTNQFELLIIDNRFELSYSKYGLIQLKSSSQNQAIEIVRRRVDEIGTNEPNILKRGNDRILVELPGLDNPDRIKSLLGKTAKMNFRLVDEKNMQSLNEKKYFVGSEILEHSEMQINYVIKKRVGVSGDNLVDASASVDQFNRPIVSIRFDSIGSRKFADLTSKNVGKRFAIVLDNKVISAPVIQEPIPTGNAQISGNFTFETANDLAILLRAGSLPAPITIAEERTVGPSLGKDSIKAGSVSLMIAFGLVLLYMFLIYGKVAFIANFVLIINILFLVAWLVLLDATLTLPGIAGIALTVGMAVDANVLIFERIREEQMLGRSKISSIETGFSQAFRAILDANVTTLIAAIVLFSFGTGPIKGFAVTLSLGILTSMFTAIMGTRAVVNLVYGKKKLKDLNI